MISQLQSYVEDRWLGFTASEHEIRSAVSGEVIAETGRRQYDPAAALHYARTVGGPALRRLTFHERGRILKAVAETILARKAELYALSAHSGATRSDAWIDIEGGTATLFSYASRARRELPDAHFMLDGSPEILGKMGEFIGQHVCISRRGAAVHLNAFNFPVWGMLEKLAPAFLAGVPVIAKPATVTAYVAEQAMRTITDAELMPPGALQLLIGPGSDLLDHLEGQDVVSFTGSASTAASIKAHPVLVREGTRIIAEQDSLNAAILGEDAGRGSAEFGLFAAEVVREMTVKAGQKCTAIRRILVPRARMDEVEAELADRLASVSTGDPSRDDVSMGPLVSLAQRDDVRRAVR